MNAMDGLREANAQSLRYVVLTNGRRSRLLSGRPLSSARTAWRVSPPVPHDIGTALELPRYTFQNSRNGFQHD